ncbi:hypothetical protein FB45DRAFT_949401 [Roridomyces roridus]|uniref:Uncharacterized protein n=1 Tax=Roridomyces roridus TaxID=1738132 RepID=A0AAD7B188_9AGAR|nr:hypothetical protein FB45DRAFT_949401 [Roridomyces roridus]
MSRRLEDPTSLFLRSKIPWFLDSYRRGSDRTQETCEITLNALLLEFDQVAATGRNAFVHLINLSQRVGQTDLALFSQRGTFIDTLSPLYDAYMDLAATATKAHAACAEYLFLRRKMCREGPESVFPVQIIRVLVAFSGCLQQMSDAAAEIEKQWKATTDALRAAIDSYCIRPSLVSVFSWVDSRNAVRLGLPRLINALPEAMQKSTEGLAKFLAAYADLEGALNRIEETRLSASEALPSESDIGTTLVGLIHLDTAVMRYRACLLLANWWAADRPTMNDPMTGSTPFRKLLRVAELDFLLKYFGMRYPSWLSSYRYDVLSV